MDVPDNIHQECSLLLLAVRSYVDDRFLPPPGVSIRMIENKLGLAVLLQNAPPADFEDVQAFVQQFCERRNAELRRDGLPVIQMEVENIESFQLDI